jgi:hypothetical protein
MDNVGERSSPRHFLPTDVRPSRQSCSARRLPQCAQPGSGLPVSRRRTCRLPRRRRRPGVGSGLRSPGEARLRKKHGHPALRSLGADRAPASCLRLSATPALETPVARSLRFVGQRQKPCAAVRRGSGLHMISWRAMEASAGRMPKAKRTCRERKPGGLPRTSAERSCAAPSRVGRVEGNATRRSGRTPCSHPPCDARCRAS